MTFHEKKLPEAFEINLELNSGERLFFCGQLVSEGIQRSRAQQQVYTVLYFA